MPSFYAYKNKHDEERLYDMVMRHIKESKDICVMLLYVINNIADDYLATLIMKELVDEFTTENQGGCMSNAIFEVIGEENVDYICSEFGPNNEDKIKIEEVFLAWEEDFSKKEDCPSCTGTGYYDRQNKFVIMESILEGNSKFDNIAGAIVRMCSDYCVMKNMSPCRTN